MRSSSRRWLNGFLMKSSAPSERPEDLVDLLVLGGEEDHRKALLLTQSAQKLQAVHARHLDVEDGKIRRRLSEGGKRLRAVGIGAHLIALGFEKDRDRGQDVAVVVDQGNRGHRGLKKALYSCDPSIPPRFVDFMARP